ncbi:MAG: hypothetical protein IBX41_05540 [Methanophagales archaeon]|nr:hypothetical protein [Methanophagales archaeon]
MRLYSYVVRADSGFAPNPFWGYCTLACCKPVIRRIAEEGDWIVGCGSVGNAGNDKLIYAMKVTEKLTFEQYAEDKRFKNKNPHHGLIEERGDNIYYKNKDGKWIQRRSYHRKGLEENKNNKDKDLEGKYVLISNHYFYFGKNAKILPEEAGLKQIIKQGPGHKSRSIPKEVIEKFVVWIEKLPQGRHGEPHDFEEKVLIPKEGKC